MRVRLPYDFTAGMGSCPRNVDHLSCWLTGWSSHVPAPHIRRLHVEAVLLAVGRVRRKFR